MPVNVCLNVTIPPELRFNCTHAHTHNFSSSCYLLSLSPLILRQTQLNKSIVAEQFHFLYGSLREFYPVSPQVYGAGNNQSDLPSISANLRGTAASQPEAASQQPPPLFAQFLRPPDRTETLQLTNSSMARPLLFSTLPLERMRYYHSRVSRSSQDKEIGEHAETQIL